MPDPIWSEDGRWWWDGEAWRPAPRWLGWRYEPTPWTRPLQRAVAGWLLFRLLAGAVLIAVLLPILRKGLDSMAAGGVVVPQSIVGFYVGAVVGGSLAGGALQLTLVYGCLKGWRWVFWWNLVVFCLGAVSLPLNLFDAILFSTGLTNFPLPAWVFVWNAFVALGDVALGVWMIVALVRFGTWARRRIPVYA